MNFPALKKEDLEVKVENCNENNGAELILYKNAVIDTIMLDEAYPNKWQLTHKTAFRPDGTEEVVACIKIYNDEIKEWLSFDDVGDEAMGGNPVKTAFTDSVKRAGFIAGIGRELKNKMPRIYFPFDKLGTKFGPYEGGYTVPQGDIVITNLVYDDKSSPKRRIVALEAKCLSSGKSHNWDFTKETTTATSEAKETTAKETVKEKKTQKTVKKDNTTNVATPTIISPSDAEPKLSGFMNIPIGTDEETVFVDTSKESKKNEKKTEETAPVVNEEVSKEPAIKPAVMAKTTTPPFDEANPGLCFVMFGKFMKNGNRVQDLTAVELRRLHQHPACDGMLKKAITLYALANPNINAEFIANGIALKA